MTRRSVVDHAVAWLCLLAVVSSADGAQRSALRDGVASPSVRTARKTLATATEDSGGGRRATESQRGGDRENGSSEDEAEVVRYHLWPAEDIKKELDRWVALYPDFVRVTSSQERYGLPRAGTQEDCPFDDEQDGCANYILTIQDYTVYPQSSDASHHLPEVFWSGCLHGNERVGPTATMEAAHLLLQAAACESLPRRDADVSQRQQQLQQARQCRAKLKAKGIDDAHRRWLARLVTTRRLVVTPMSNALGYYRNKREELDVDPNRDFPYDLKNPSTCMQTVTGRTLNELFREHMFQLALTFHAGMEVVAYEWGAPSWYNHLSPDDTAQNLIAAAYSRFGGEWSGTKPYQFGTMNDLVYYVRGGMEDWAYAGAFDQSRVPQCTPNTFGGYPKEKTTYNNSTLRVFNMLIETSDDKTPRRNSLGTSLDVMHRDTAANGHVSRNIRLALLALDLVQPYLATLSVNDVVMSDDIVPAATREGRNCQHTHGAIVAQNAQSAEIEFTVGGALTIDEVQIWYAKWDDVPANQLDCLTKPDNLEGFRQGQIIGPTSGTGVFSIQGSTPRPEGFRHGSGALGPAFRASIDLSEGFGKLDRIVVIAAAKVDQNWKDTPEDARPPMPPQSHIVNARTDPNWHHESAGKHIKGRLMWYSEPVTIVIGDFDDNVGKQGDRLIDTIELGNRFGTSDENGRGGVVPATAGADDRNIWPLVTIVAVVSLICIGCSMGSGTKPLSSSRRKVNQAFSDKDDFVFDSRPYSDFDDETHGAPADGVEITELGDGASTVERT